MFSPIAFAGVAASLLCALTACGPNYSPNTYAGNVVQQANKVDQGVIVGVRAVAISAQPGIGTAAAGAAGGIAGSQVGQGPVSALTALGGSLAGGLAGVAVEHSTEDTVGYEYIVRKPNGDLLSVTQKDDVALTIGRHVLIIEGAQARVVPDYTLSIEVADPSYKPPPVHPAETAEAHPPAPVESPAKIVAEPPPAPSQSGSSATGDTAPPAAETSP